MSARPYILILALGLVTGCGPTTTTTSVAPATDAEVERFCDRYEEVRDLSRTEMLRELIDYAPSEIIGPIARASNRGGSFEDDIAINAFIDRCTSDLSSP